MEATLSSHLLRLADAYCAVTSISSATVSERAGGDWQFFDKMRGGRLNYRIRTYDRAVSWFASHWPSSEPWPEGVPRPSELEPEGVG